MRIRIIIHYVFAVAVLSLYGGRVCYLVDTLNILTWTKFLAITFTAAYLLRWLVWSRIVGAGRKTRPTRAFAVDLGMFVAVAAFITAYNDSMYGFGVHSGLKVAVGVIAMGFFIGVDSALGVEREQLQESAASGVEFGAGEKIVPLPLKFSVIGSITVVLVVMVVYLFFARDILLIGEGQFDDYDVITGRMSSELMFLCGVILVEVINMVVSYSRSMKLQFQYHAGALLAVAEGDLGKRVPVATKDEFGLIARYTNLMISTLGSRTTEKQTAENATKLKDQFVSLVAHDLRSPFNSILGLLKIAARDEDTVMAPKHKELMAKAIASSEMLVKTIDHLLDISMLQTGKMQLEPRFFETRQLVQSGIDQHSALAEKKGITITNALPPSLKIFADPVLVGEILTNLFSNGVKFCKAGNVITASSPEGEPNTIVVRDTGVGIPKHLVPDVFKAEVKTSSTGTAGEKGTGLGLPFCADIMRAHGGEITVDSEQGWGSVFTLRFPVVPPVILLCLQDTVSRAKIAESLRQSGMSPVEAHSSDEAERVALETKPHLTVIDVDGDVLRGMDILGKIRSNEQTSKLRILAVSSSDKIEDKSAVLQLKVSGIADGRKGTDDILSKIQRLV
jgi:signal transduction histidine kinase